MAEIINKKLVNKIFVCVNCCEKLGYDFTVINDGQWLYPGEYTFCENCGEIVDYMLSPGARVSNTLAPNTEGNSLIACVDWLSASFVLEKNFSEIQELFYLKEEEVNGQIVQVKFEKFDGARYEFADYKETYRYSFIEFMHDPDTSKWFINLSGQGCREFERISKLDFEELLGLLIGQLYATVTRLDIAIDDFKNIYNVKTFRNAVLKGQCLTKIRTWGSHTQGKINSSKNELIMDNFYLGTLKSRYSINVYDKKLERQAKGKKVDEKTWTRTEVRFRNEYATYFARIIASSYGNDNVGIFVKAFLKGHLCFLSKTALKKDTNKSRLAEDEKNYVHWWKRFLGSIDDLKFSLKKPERSVEKVVSWIDKQVFPSLIVLEEVFEDEFPRLLYELSKRNDTRLTKTHQFMINDAKRKGLTLEQVLDQLRTATK